MPAKEPKREFKVGDKVRVNLHHGKIEDAVVRAVIQDDDGIKLQAGIVRKAPQRAQIAERNALAGERHAPGAPTLRLRSAVPIVCVDCGL